MRQVSRKMNLNPPSGRLRYNLGDYIRKRGFCEKGDLKKEKKKGISL